MSWAISSIIMPSIGGFLAVYFPEYRPVYLAAGVITALSLVIFWFFTKGDIEDRNSSKMSDETSK